MPWLWCFTASLHCLGGATFASFIKHLFHAQRISHLTLVFFFSSYLLNLIGQCLDLDALLDQCCRMISSLLKIFKIKQLEGTAVVLGEQLQVDATEVLILIFIYIIYAITLQVFFNLLPFFPLQFLISKLVMCCISSESSPKLSADTSSQVLSLLSQLTLDSDPSLHEYIKVCIYVILIT